MYFNKEETETALYYFFMKADGNISYDEMKMFNELCKTNNINGDTKENILKYCNDFSGTSKDFIGSLILKDKSSSVTRAYLSIASSMFLTNAITKSDEAKIIWNLVNLGYSDTVFSDEEKEFINYLITEWKFDKVVYQEMIDTAETLLALTKQKDWLLRTYGRGAFRDKKEKKIDDDMEKLHSDILLSIKEYAM